MDYAIECINLTHYYGKKLVYENLNFQVPEGTILGLLGKNGSGKTTTINILNGFLQPRSGRCLIYGEDSQRLSPANKARIGFLIEGHIQYSFMDIHQIEKFYSGFYPKWDREPYWELMSKLKVTPHQKISSMSCGQRSQVALGLILAQDPDLLILDDFSMGLDPGYRRLFIDYLRAYAKARHKTIFTTSHIVQDMERLIDDVLIMDYNRVLTQRPVEEFMREFKQFSFELEDEKAEIPQDGFVANLERVKDKVELYTYQSEEFVRGYLHEKGIAVREFRQVEMGLEDAFIGLTGKY
ncbi:MAG TPA: ABC transporter ATP-binding protein [Prolixibacteraceae bacterium]|nr:ABC transporter ATP-binding protein [Prolixibacteraceae bacterium]HOS90543.1 ABC transporter ATP-binding protein [Prolixibacteraceae bacterium]HPL45597.1 ABC transporter ATP-binding protein [Prolixibacteraceae bacterium]HQE52656.1 ABC transporter ATP-binding protein [Prolixibacteraceae bacterium]HQJ85855.1 ABC transporter ATP-binding protein [Prolixibacteraceae bacterium]